MYKDNGLSIDYVEIKLPATNLNGNIYQRERGADAQQRNQSWKQVWESFLHLDNNWSYD